ncbi:MAG: hypothetical protein AMXMBFR61_27840 [Fimbriimonadales bacterium]
MAPYPRDGGGTLVLSVTVDAQPVPGSPWPMAGRDARHTGRQVFAPLFGLNPGSIYWIFDTGQPTRRLQASVAIGPEGRIFFGSDMSGSGKLFAVDVLNGQPSLAWAYYRDAPNGPVLQDIFSKPALGLYVGSGQEDGEPAGGGDSPVPVYAVYFGCDDGRLRCLSRTGQLLWRSRYVGDIEDGPVIASNGRVYVCGTLEDGRGYLYAFSPVNSGLEVEPIWSYQVGGNARGAPAVWEADGYAYVIALSVNGQLSKVRDDGAWGTAVWTRSLLGPYFSYPVIGDDGTIYCATFWLCCSDNWIYAVRMDNGELKWEALPNRRISVATKTNVVPPVTGAFGPVKNACIGPGGDVYLGTQVVHLGPFQGEHHLLRITDLGTTGIATVAHVANPSYRVDPVPMTATKSPTGTTYLVFAPESGLLYVSDPSGQSVYYPFPTMTARLDNPGIVMDHSGIIYVGANNGKLYAVVGPH